MNALMTQQQGNGFFAPQDPAAFAAAEAVKARIQSAYIMAMQRPRDEETARQKMLDACRRPGFAAEAEYSKPVGGGKITGLSIRFTEMAMREWSNVLADTQVVYEDEKIRRIKVTVTDLETNAAYSQDIQIAKTVERKSQKGRDVVSERTNSYGEKVFIVIATDDELMNKEGSAISKAMRNMVSRLLPADIKEEATSVIRQTVANKTSADPKAERRKVLDAFSGIGIYSKDIQKYLKHPVEQMTPAEISDLRGVYRAIKDGEATWASYVEDSGNGDDAPPEKKPTNDIYGTPSKPDANADEATTDKKVSETDEYRTAQEDKNLDPETYQEAMDKLGLKKLNSVDDCNAVHKEFGRLIDEWNQG